MPDPINNQSNLRIELANYLMQETIQYYPDIQWLYYLQAHDPTMTPRGAIFLDRITRNRQLPYNIDNSSHSYQFHLRLKISTLYLADLLASLENWESELNDKIAKKLQIEGYNGYFQGIYPDTRQPSVLEVDKNQDEGAKGNLHLFWVWNDMGKVTGDQTGEFL